MSTHQGRPPRRLQSITFVPSSARAGSGHANSPGVLQAAAMDTDLRGGISSRSRMPPALRVRHGRSARAVSAPAHTSHAHHTVHTSLVVACALARSSASGKPDGDAAPAGRAAAGGPPLTAHDWALASGVAAICAKRVKSATTLELHHTVERGAHLQCPSAAISPPLACIRKLCAGHESRTNAGVASPPVTNAALTAAAAQICAGR